MGAGDAFLRIQNMFFRKKTDDKASGLSENSQRKRMTICMSSYIMLIFGGIISQRLFFVFSFGLSPILHLFDMDET